MQIKNVTLSATTETEITIEQGYPYVWFKNLGDNTVYVSASPDILDNGSVKTEGVSTITSGECTSVTTKSDKVYAYALGATVVEVHAQGNPESSFKIKAKGGESFLGKTTTVLTDGSTTNPIIVNGKSVTAKNGDIALYDKQEFIFDGTEWNAFGDQSGLGALAYKDTATGTAITTAGTLPTLVYDSTNERFIFNAGTLPTSGTVTVS